MTVSVEVPFQSYSGNGVTTEFPVPFEWSADSELVVTLRVDATGAETVQTITTHYTVDGGDGSNGSITMLTAPATGETLVITRSTPLAQDTDFQENGLVLLETIEEGFDSVVRMLQEMAADIATGIQAPTDFDPNDDPYRLPHPVAGQVLIGNDDEDGWEHVELADLATLEIPVVITNLQTGDVLQYDGTNWVNASGGGGTFVDPMTTDGDMIVRAAGAADRLAIGAADTVLTSDGSAPSWAKIADANIDASAAIALTKLANIADKRLLANVLGGGTAGPPTEVSMSAMLDAAFPITQNGDILIRTGGTWARLPIGTTGQVLTVVSGVPAWAAPAGGGLDVVAEKNQTVAAASIAFTSVSGYKELIILYDIAPASNGVAIHFKGVKSTSTVIDNTTHTALASTGSAALAEGQVVDVLDVDGGNMTVPNTANSGRCAGVIFISDIQASTYKTVTGVAHVGGNGLNLFGGQVQDTAALTGGQFTASSGNITGRVLVLGVPA